MFYKSAIVAFSESAVVSFDVPLVTCALCLMIAGFWCMPSHIDLDEEGVDGGRWLVGQLSGG